MTNNIIKTISVDEGYALELEKRFYEMKVYEQLVEKFTSNSKFNIDDSRYKILLDENKEAFKAYNIVWQMGITKYVPAEDRIYAADFDFAEQCFLMSEVVHDENCPLCVKK